MLPGNEERDISRREEEMMLTFFYKNKNNIERRKRYLHDRLREPFVKV
jgi:hypothetical protein